MCRTYNNISRFDLFLLGVCAPHFLLDFDGPPYCSVDAHVQEYEAYIRKYLCHHCLCHEIVVDNVVFAGA